MINNFGYPGPARGAEAPTTHPAGPETRAGNDSTERRKLTSLLRSKRVRVMAGIATAVALGIGFGVEAHSRPKEVIITTTPNSKGHAGGAAEQPPTAEPTPTPTSEKTAMPHKSLFPEATVTDPVTGETHKTRELTLDQVRAIGMPDTDTYTVSKNYHEKTWPQKLQEAQRALQQIDQVIQYSVNTGDPESMERVNAIFSDTYTPAAMNANELDWRAKFIQANRGNYIPDDYAWGFVTKPVKHELISRPDAGSIWVVAETIMGDYDSSTGFEPHKKQLLAFKMTNRANLMVNRPNKDGIWGIADVRPVDKKGNDYQIIFDGNEHSALQIPKEVKNDDGKPLTKVPAPLGIY